MFPVVEESFQPIVEQVKAVDVSVTKDYDKPGTPTYWLRKNGLLYFAVGRALFVMFFGLKK